MEKENNEIQLSKTEVNQRKRDETFTQIINSLIEGETIANTLKSNKDYPTAATFFNWLIDDPHKQTLYKYAREVLAHKLFDDLNDIAKGVDIENDSVVKVQRDRLRTDTIKFYISKILPKVYGDKIDVTSNGEAINVVSLGVGIKPELKEDEYIDITDENE
jgi:hypothetical protein